MLKELLTKVWEATASDPTRLEHMMQSLIDSEPELQGGTFDHVVLDEFYVRDLDMITLTVDEASNSIVFQVPAVLKVYWDKEETEGNYGKLVVIVTFYLYLDLIRARDLSKMIEAVGTGSVVVSELSL